MSEAWREATVRNCERIAVNPDTDLVRVWATGPIRPDAGEERPMLVADDGETETCFGAIPAPADTDLVLRCAFAVPAGLSAEGTTFSLEFGDTVVALPHPAGATAVAAAPTAAPGLDLGLLVAAAEARAELQAVQDIAALGRRPAVSGSGDADARLMELETWSGELERRLADATVELEEAQALLHRHGLRPGAGPSTASGLDGTELSALTGAACAAADDRARADLASALA